MSRAEQLFNKFDLFNKNNPFNVLDHSKSLFFLDPIYLTKVEKQIENHFVCPIMYTDINTFDEYMTCQDCKYNFSVPAIIKHLRNNDTCPMCRSTWYDVTIYIVPEHVPSLAVLNNVFKKKFTIGKLTKNSKFIKNSD